MLHAATNMHNKMVEKVMRAKILFFDSNPIGRITTRFTKDMMITDTMISNYAIFVSMFFFRILFVFITVIIVNPYLLIVFAISSIFVYRVANLGIHPMIEC
jgi:ABC-type multidrug transport system fused ATPase/permease subunit